MNEPCFTYPRSKLHAVGHYSSPSLILSIPAADAQSMLPRRLKLDAQTLTPAGEHPLVVLLGHHRGVKLAGSKRKGGSYFEFVLALPYLRYEGPGDGYRGPFAYMRRLYLSSWYYTILGWFYAYAKHRGRVDGNDSSYRVRSLWFGRRLVEADFHSAGVRGPATGNPAFDRVSAVWQQPFMGKLWFTPYLASVLRFELEKATVEPLELDLDIARACVAGLPTGRFPIPSIEQSLLGAYRLDVPWTLSLPMLPSSLKPCPTTET